jgi:hypothetical protein
MREFSYFIYDLCSHVVHRDQQLLCAEVVEGGKAWKACIRQGSETQEPLLQLHDSSKALTRLSLLERQARSVQ